jgi:hypothetical protein
MGKNKTSVTKGGLFVPYRLTLQITAVPITTTKTIEAKLPSGTSVEAKLPSGTSVEEIVYENELLKRQINNVKSELINTQQELLNYR